MADQQPQYFVKEFLPRFDIDYSPSQSICSECCDHIPIIGSERHYCECRCRVYCKACWASKETMHTHQCTVILGKTQEVHNKLQAFDTWWGFDVHEYLISVAPGNLYEFSYEREDRMLALHDVKAYFKAREELIKLLIDDAFTYQLLLIDDAFTFRYGNSNINTLALDIALLQCKDLFHLDKVDSNYFREEGIGPKKEYLLSLLLFMGKFEEHYNVCCYYAQYGEQFFHPLSEDDCPLYDIYPVTKAKEKFEVDMTCSFLEDYSLHHNHFPRLALNHMFIHKYVLHENMENLRLLHLNLLDNEDCVALIGEYIGMKKDWLKYEKNWYKNQALEVLKEFARSEKFEFGIIHGMSDIFLGSGKYKQIDTALKIGRGQLNCYRNDPRKKLWGAVSDSWASDMNNREWDVEGLDFHGMYLSHPLQADLIVEKLNEIAGYSQFGANHFGRRMSATKFLTEVAEVCDKKDLGCFEEFLNFLDDYSYISSELLKCLVFERRLIQANFYQNHCYTDEDIQGMRMRENKCKTLLAHEVLDKLPRELRPYSYGRPLPLLDDDPFLNYPMEECHAYPPSEEIRQVGGWLSDVTVVIDALFHADLATDENLSAIFGDSSMVSYRLYQLRKMREEKHQKSITSFFNKNKSWKEGYIVCSSTGVNIHYLSKNERRKRFEEMGDSERKSRLAHFRPSLSQFRAKFGWKNLGLQSNKSYFGVRYLHGRVVSVLVSLSCQTKWSLRSLDGMNIDQACRHYFDTSSLEEGIWDFLGIPRLEILIAGQQGRIYHERESRHGRTLRNAGWMPIGRGEHFLGDRAVIMGKRVAQDENGDSWYEGGHGWVFAQDMPLPPDLY